MIPDDGLNHFKIPHIDHDLHSFFFSRSVQKSPKLKKPKMPWPQTFSLKEENYPIKSQSCFYSRLWQLLLQIHKLSIINKNTWRIKPFWPVASGCVTQRHQFLCLKLVSRLASRASWPHMIGQIFGWSWLQRSWESSGFSRSSKNGAGL